MRTRRLGKLGIEASELALGTWGLSGDGYGDVSDSDKDAVIDAALEAGITLFETADSYAEGAMERKLGERIGDRTGTWIATKIGTFRGPSHRIKKFDAVYLREAVAKSAERLKRSKIDIVLLHNPVVSTLLSGEATGQLGELVREGAIGAWGVSVGDAPTARAALSMGAEVIELAYNAFFRRDLEELASDLSTHGVGVLARSVLAHGLLAGMMSQNHVFADGDHRRHRWTGPELRTRVRQLDALRPLVTGEVLTLRAAALRYVLANELVSSAVTGPRSVAQLEQLVREAGAGPPYLPDQALARLRTDLIERGVDA